MQAVQFSKRSFSASEGVPRTNFYRTIPTKPTNLLNFQAVPTFLLTFNPQKGGDFGDYESAVALTRSGKPYPTTWRVKSSHIVSGDRIFILRQGKVSPGIIAEGFAVDRSVRGPAGRDGSGRQTFRVAIELRAVLGPEEQPLPWPLPERATNGKFKGPFGSGDSIPADVAGLLEAAWSGACSPKRLLFDIDAALNEPSIRASQDIIMRQGQGKFREDLLRAYSGRCALSDCDHVAALEAAHIVQHSGPASNHVQNGLLLRADLHTLFDLKLFTFDPECLTVSTNSSLKGTSYEWLAGAKLKTPTNPNWHPNIDALRHHAGRADWSR
jgi:hypothetical protein